MLNTTEADDDVVVDHHRGRRRRCCWLSSRPTMMLLIIIIIIILIPCPFIPSSPTITGTPFPSHRCRHHHHHHSFEDKYLYKILSAWCKSIAARWHYPGHNIAAVIVHQSAGLFGQTITTTTTTTAFLSPKTHTDPMRNALNRQGAILTKEICSFH